ncbi:hypothetical protein CU097_013364 [Rhizopus azygosporus]|uniref:SH3 domain-containing protein n=1 Tax=Rhizopus azygosporus TaxID=86630 RepID=A0A367KCC3_RHIAZ|nr:hypothetical protein CU097_013364 [Rhizopus azygosporus]
MHFSDNTEIMETGAQSMVTSELSNGESTDAIEDFRLTLKNLIQKLARGIALNAPSDELKIKIKTYTAQDVAQELDQMDQLLSLKMVASESVEAFTGRFQCTFCAAKWDDDMRTTTIFKRTLPAFLRQEISRSLLNLSRDQQDTVNKVTTKTQLKNAQRGMNLGVFKSFTPGTTKNKFQCAVHGLANHPTEKCKRYKYFLTNHAHPSGTSTAPAATPTGSGTASPSSGSNICFHCTGNISWSREHAAVCPHDKSNLRPARAICSARLVSAFSSSAPAPTRATAPTVETNQLPDSNGMMDINDNGFPVDYNYNKLAVAHHPYEAQREDEISFEKDEVIKVTDDSDPDWWVGAKKDGTSGYFPSNFVNVKQEEQSTVEEQEEKEEENENKVDDDEEQDQKKVDQVIGMARVMEDYAMQEPGEISLHRGGIVNVYEVIDDHWARGELNGKVGRYPIKYVEDIDMPGRPDLGKQVLEKPQATSNEEQSGPKGGFKLAAYGVKQGGIGSLLAGGFPGLKKAPAKQEEPAATEEPRPTPAAAVPKAEEEEKEEKPTVEEPKPLGKAIVLHPYNADNEDELNLLRGEYVEILDRNVDDGWWKGKNERGQTGVFPANFVKELDEEPVAPPTPVRSTRQPLTNAPLARPPVARPASVQAGGSTRPFSVQSSAPRPSTVQVLSDASMAVPPKPFASSEREVKEEVKEEPDVKLPTSPNQPSFADEPASQPPAPEQEVTPSTPSSIPKRQDSIASASSIPSSIPVAPVDVPEAQIPPAIPTRPESISDNTSSPPSIPKRQGSVSSTHTSAPHAEPLSEESTVPESKESPVAAEEVIPVTNAQTEEALVPESREIVEDQVEKAKEEVQKEDIAVETPKVESELPASEENATESKEEEAAVEPKAEKEASATKEGKETGEQSEEKKGIEILPSGPKLTTPTRARIGVPRRSPQLKNTEPSQTEILQKQIAEAPEEEKQPAKATPSPPAKPVKPIFAKFPTPFAVGGGEEISKKMLKPTQVRKPWEQEEKPSETEEPEAPRPVGVRSIASRFNVSNNSGNEVLETKLKNHTKNEVEKVRKEFQQLLQEEQEKRAQLEGLVHELLERINQLENKQ